MYGDARLITIAFAIVSLVATHLSIAEDIDNELKKIVSVTSERNQRLQSLFVKYHLESKVLGDPAAAKRYMNVFAEVKETKTFAFKGQKRYFATDRGTDTLHDISPATLPEEHPTKGLPKDIVKSQRQPSADHARPSGIKVERAFIRAFDGNRLQSWRSSDNAYMLFGKERFEQEESDSSDFDAEYLKLSYYSVPDVFTKDKREGIRLPGVLTARKAVLRQRPETVDGSSCVVVDVNETDTLWCDPQLSYAVRRWERREKGTNHTTWKYNLSDFAMVTEGVWFPRHCVRLRWAQMKAPFDVRAKPLMQYEYEVEDIHANDVPDSLFTLTIPSGKQVYDFANGVVSGGAKQALSYTMPADGKQLDRVITETRSGIIKAQSFGRVSWQRVFFLLLNLCVIVVIVLVIISKRRRKVTA